MGMRQLVISNSITNRDSRSLDIYLNEVKKMALVSAEEEVVLVQQIKHGDRQALNTLVKANLRFVVSVAKQYQGKGLALADLVNEGNYGLLKAAQKFDDTRGFKFISFAVWWIRESILSAISIHSRTIRCPLHKQTLARRIQNTQAMLEQQLDRAASIEEVAEAMEMQPGEVADILSRKDNSVSLDTPLTEDGETSLLDTLENKDAISADRHLTYTESLKTEIERSLSILTEKQKETVCYFFGIGYDRALSLEAIGEKLNLTTERIRQIRDKAILKLRNSKQLDVLRSYMSY
jgi:RNA polymerase primary sigma factor